MLAQVLNTRETEVIPATGSYITASYPTPCIYTFHERQHIVELNTAKQCTLLLWRGFQLSSQGQQLQE